MRKVVLYIAMSLDGYIADKNNSVSWLSGDHSETNAIVSYFSFYDTVDTVILGWNTYHQIVNELSPNEWPYKEKTTYVLTHHKDEKSKSFDTSKTLISSDDCNCHLGG